MNSGTRIGKSTNPHTSTPHSQFQGVGSGLESGTREVGGAEIRGGPLSAPALVDVSNDDRVLAFAPRLFGTGEGKMEGERGGRGGDQGVIAKVGQLWGN